MAAQTLYWQQSDDEHTTEPTTPVRAGSGGGGGDGVAPICIGVVVGPLRAELARSYLEQAGIDVFLQGAAVASAYGLVGGPLGEVRVFVPAAQSEEATRIFSELDLSQ
jgi:hypothetical protein